MILTNFKDLRHLRSENPDSKIVMVNGAFDLFHVSHLELLEKSKCLGDLLVVCITSDESLRKGKGEDRPIISQSQRAGIIESLRCVDYVFLNKDGDSNDLTNWPGYNLRPNVIVSSDKRWYQTDPRVTELGIETIILPRGSISTTEIIKKIKG